VVIMKHNVIGWNLHCIFPLETGEFCSSIVAAFIDVYAKKIGKYFFCKMELRIMYLAFLMFDFFFPWYRKERAREE